MKKLLALYFSGTGNTEYAVKRLCSAFSLGKVDCTVCSVEGFDKVKETINDFDTLLVAYPIYGSDMPRIMKEFLSTNAEVFESKKLITLVTQLVFSGDGGALVSRFLRKRKVHHDSIASIHVNMPSNISDFTIFRVKNGDDNNPKIQKANKKLDKSAKKIFDGKKIKNGNHFFSFAMGFFGQRMLYRAFLEKRYVKKLKIDKELCIKCGKCVVCCPMKNISIDSDLIQTHDNCTLCYRCVNLCPKKAISLLSKAKPRVQYKGIKTK